MNFIPSDFDTFDEAVRDQDEKIQMYISKLSNRQVSILNLLVDGYQPNEIRQMLEISLREYSDDLSIMRCYENIRILF